MRRSTGVCVAKLRHPGKRTCCPGHTVGHHRADARRFGVPPGSRTRLTCLEGKVLAARTAVRKSTIENGVASGNCPRASDLASRHASHNTLATTELRAGLAPASGEVAARRLSSSVQRSRQMRRRRESNARDLGRPRFSKPACYHSSTSPYPRQDSNLHQAAFVARCPSFGPRGHFGVPSGSRTPSSRLKGAHPSPRRPMGHRDPAGSRTRFCALRGRRHSPRRPRGRRGERRSRTSGAHHHHPGFRDRLPTIRQRSPRERTKLWRRRESNPHFSDANAASSRWTTSPSCLGGRNRTCVDLVPGQVASH